MDLLNNVGKKRFYRDWESGQSLVEFAIVFPLMIILLLGIIQFGFILNGLVVVNAAAREGARAEAVGEDGEAAAGAVCNAALMAGTCGASNGGGITFSATAVMRDETEDGSGQPVPFEYTVSVPVILPFLEGSP